MARDTSPLDPRRRPLHAIFRAYLATFLAAHLLPKFTPPGVTKRVVRDELEGYLDCGVLSCGCARYECQGCELTRVVALHPSGCHEARSCKGRGFCPRCLGRRMAQAARDLVARVLPHVHIRHWVFSLPFALRVRLAFDHDQSLALWRIAQREIDRRYRRLGREAGIANPRGGSVLVIHRAGSDLKLNLHYHATRFAIPEGVLFLDGVFDDSGHFFKVPAPSPTEVEQILARIIVRAERLLGEGEPPEQDGDEAQLARVYGSSTPAERHAPDDDDDPHDFGFVLPTRRKARIDQWDLDAEVAVSEHDRPRLEQLCRYILRPPLALDRLRLLDDGRVCLALKRPWADRTTHVTMTPDVFLGRLASLVPRPERNTTIYFGVLAAHAKHRDLLVPCPEDERRVRPDASWATLMKYSFGLNALKCPRCGARMRFMAVILDRKEVRRLLEHLELWSDPLPAHPARGPPDDCESQDFG